MTAQHIHGSTHRTFSQRGFAPAVSLRPVDATERGGYVAERTLPRFSRHAPGAALAVSPRPPT